MIADEARELRINPIGTGFLPVQSEAELNAMGPSEPITTGELNGSLLDAWREIINLERRVARIEKGS